MKKTILLLCFSLITSWGMAQDLGIKAGLTYTNFKGNNAGDFDYRLGYTGGLMLQHHITTNVGIQTEALFTSKGARRNFEINGVNVEERLRMNYIDVPVMLHVSSAGFFVDAGPQISFLAKARQLRKSVSGESSTTIKTNITDDPYAIDFGYVAGLGYRALNGVGVELRYNGGLKNIYDEGPLVGLNRRHSTILFMVSFMLPGGV